MQSQERRRNVSLEQARQSILKADAAISNAQQSLSDFLAISDDPEPKLHTVSKKLITAKRALMQSTGTVTREQLRRGL